MRWLALLVMALALVAAGCGGGDDESAASDETTIEETTTSSEETTTEETTEADETETEASGSGTGFVTEDCIAAVAAFSSLAAGVGAASGGNAEGVEEAASQFEAYADKAPEEIQDDIRVLAEAYAVWIKAVNDLGLQPGETPSAEQLAQLGSASQQLNTPEVAEASENFNNW